MKQRPVRKLLALVLSLLLVLAFTPAAFAEEGNVAKNATTGVEYTKLSEAISNASDGDRIELLSDTSESQTGIYIDSNKKITLDLKGFTLTGDQTLQDAQDAIFTVGSGSSLTVVNGKIDAKGWHAFALEGGTLKINADAEVSSVQCCVYLKAGSTLETSGKLYSTGAYTISGNHSQGGGPTYTTINGGTVENAYNGGTTSEYDGFAIYQPQGGSIIVNAGTITGNNGIGIKSGTLEINGGTISGKANTTHEAVSVGNGIDGCGSAIVIDSRKPYEGSTIEINGGLISSEYTNAINETGEDPEKLNSISISGTAELSSGDGKKDLNILNDDSSSGKSSKVSVKDGTFSKNIEKKYLSDDAIAVKSGDNYYVGDAANKEIASATAGETIEVTNGTTITGVPEGVKVTNNTGEDITVNNEKVAAGDNITIESKPEPQPEPSNPSSSFTEPEYYPDYDEDVDYLPPVEDEEEEEKAPLYMVTCRTLNVRMGPGTSYAKLGTLSRGTLISGEYENGWVKFTYNGQTAYSSADYLMQVDGDLSGLHVTCRTLNVRAGAGTNFDILGTLSRGTEISVRDVLPGWYEIDFLSGIGYVSSAYIG